MKPIGNVRWGSREIPGPTVRRNDHEVMEFPGGRKPMALETSAPTRTENFWWGLGVYVEGQIYVGGTRSVTAHMFSIDGNYTCFIQTLGWQVGPGLGGGGDVILLIATGISSPASFSNAEVEGGWSGSARFGEVTSGEIVTWAKMPKDLYRLSSLIKNVPVSKILDRSVVRPDYVLKLKDAIVDFYGAVFDTASVAGDTILSRPKLHTFTIAGGGFQLDVVYNFHNRVKLL